MIAEVSRRIRFRKAKLGRVVGSDCRRFEPRFIPRVEIRSPPTPYRPPGGARLARFVRVLPRRLHNSRIVRSGVRSRVYNGFHAGIRTWLPNVVTMSVVNVSLQGRTKADKQPSANANTSFDSDPPKPRSTREACAHLENGGRIPTPGSSSATTVRAMSGGRAHYQSVFAVRWVRGAR